MPSGWAFQAPRSNGETTEPLSDLRADLNNLRPSGRFTRDLFSRAGRALARKSLIFLDPHTAAWPATSDNGHCVHFAKREGGTVLTSPGQHELAGPQAALGIGRHNGRVSVRRVLPPRPREGLN